MTKPLGGFQPPSGTMLWGSRAGGRAWRGGRLSDALFCVLCFVFRVLCSVLGAMPCCPAALLPSEQAASGLGWQPATRRMPSLETRHSSHVTTGHGPRC